MLRPGGARPPGGVDLKRPVADLEYQLITQAMEQAGLEPPQACRAGVCGVCRCRVVTGQASMLSNQVLSEEEQRQGWILACQAVVGSPFVELQY
mgnify:CR=1 FL=1